MNKYSISSDTYSKRTDIYPISSEISDTKIHSHQNSINEDINLKFYIIKYKVILRQSHMPFISFQIKFKTQNIPGTNPWSVGYPSMTAVFLDTMLRTLVLVYPSTKPGVHKSEHMVAPSSFIIITAVPPPPLR